MRKVLVLLLAILMVFTIVACKQEPEQNNELPVEKEAGKDALMEQGASGSKAVDHTGFKITVTMKDETEDESFEIGGKDDIYWLNLGEYAILTRDHDNSTYMFMPLEAPLTSFWLKVSDKSLKEEVFTEAVDALLYNAYDYKDYLDYVGDETKYGRSCSKYTVNVTEEGVKYSFSILVDKEYGITMGMQASANDESFTYTINPKLSGLIDSDLPANYAAAASCAVYQDTMAL